MIQNFKEWKDPQLSEDRVGELFARAEKKVKVRRLFRARLKRASVFAAVILLAGGIYFQQRFAGFSEMDVIAKLEGDVAVLSKMEGTYNDAEGFEGGARENIN